MKLQQLCDELEIPYYLSYLPKGVDEWLTSLKKQRHINFNFYIDEKEVKDGI